MVAKDAMSYQSLKDKRPIVQKKVANAPKVVKPGVAKSSASSGREQIEKIGKLRKTGNIKMLLLRYLTLLILNLNKGNNNGTTN